MGQKKGAVPAHIQPKTFSHPGANAQCIIILSRVADPRQLSCNTRYSVVTILFIVFIAVLCGAKNWEEIYHVSEGLSDWLELYVDVSCGIPSRWTLERVVSLIPTAQLQPLFLQFARTLQKGGTVAIDGKTLCGTRSWEGGNHLHLLHAWSLEEGICLGQISVNEKSNEITALPDLIAQLELKGLIVTADALHTQKGAVDAIVKKGADYVLPVKGNHADLLEDIQLLFKASEEEQFSGMDGAQLETLEKNGGRVENRKYALLDAEGLSGIEAWANCCCVGKVERTRSEGSKESKEVCYYITSLDFDINQFAKSVRGHWSVENGLHWSLDVIFREDNHRYQQRVGAANLSLMRKIALAVLSRDTTTKCGRATRQVKALASASYRDHLLKNCF
jgi:predicted transposase YbfD/YdcC